MQRAGQFFEQALGKAGTKYAVREMQSAEKGDVVLDGAGEVRYNKKGYDPLINSTFPPYNESSSEANQLAIRWAHKDYVVAGDRALLSYHYRWYLIQKFDDMELGYLIMKRVKDAEYEQYRKEIESSGERNDAGIEILDEVSERIGERTPNVAGESSFDSDVVGYRQQDSDVFRLDAEESGRETEVDRKSGTDNARGGTNRQGRATRVKRTITRIFLG